MRFGIDLGSATTKISTVGADGSPTPFAPPAGDDAFAPAVATQAGAAAAGAASEFLATLLAGTRVDEVVVPVPEAWLSAGTSAETKLADLRQAVADRIGPARPRLLSDAVCVAAYLRHRAGRGSGPRPFAPRPPASAPPASAPPASATAGAATAGADQPGDGRPAAGAVVICDAGAATFAATLCVLDGDAIGVRDHAATSAAAGGAAFEDALMKVLTQRDDLPHPERERLRRLLAAQVRDGRDRARMVFSYGVSRGRSFLDARVYTVDDHDLSGTVLTEVFAPFGIEITAALHALAARNPDVLADPGTRVAVVGGFSLFPLVETAVQDALGLKVSAGAGAGAGELGELGELGERLGQAPLSAEEHVFAAAHGAALVAAGVVDPVARYPYAARLRLRQVRRGRLAGLRVPLAEAGQVRADAGAPRFATVDGRPLAIRVERHQDAAIPVEIVDPGGGVRTLALAGADHPETGAYHVGLQMDRAHRLSLVFRSVGDDTETSYPLREVL